MSVMFAIKTLENIYIMKKVDNPLDVAIFVHPNWPAKTICCLDTNKQTDKHTNHHRQKQRRRRKIKVYSEF